MCVLTVGKRAGLWQEVHPRGHTTMPTVHLQSSLACKMELCAPCTLAAPPHPRPWQPCSPLSLSGFDCLKHLLGEDSYRMCLLVTGLLSSA